MAKIAIIGANGLVGRKLVEILTAKLPQHKLVLCGDTSVGTKVDVLGRSWTVQKIQSAEQCDYAMFMASDDVSKTFVPKFSQNGVVCIDNSAAFRMKKGVPLVVPQINGQTVGCCKVISNPNCTTIQIAIALSALSDFCPTFINVVTMQSASGAGKEGLRDLQEKRSYGKLKSFPHPVFDNVLPQIGESLPNGNTAEEQKIKQELPKILSLDCGVNAFCTRVPVSVGHCALVQVKFQKQVTVAQIRQAFERTANVLLLDDAANHVYPMPQILRHTNFVGIGRIFFNDDGSCNLFTVADNLLVGAAYNAYKILEISVKNNGDWI